MTRRALSPAAHGVLLAVRAALRGRVPQITDAPDGTTSVVVFDPDGTRILRCEVRSVSRARDTRQPLLPLAPGAPHDPPAPVAVVRSEAPAATVRCWITQREWDAAMERNEEVADWLHEPLFDSELVWAGADPWEWALVPAGPVLDELRKVCQRAGITLHEGDEAPPAPADASRWRIQPDAGATSKGSAKAAKPAKRTPKPKASAPVAVVPEQRAEATAAQDDDDDDDRAPINGVAVGDKIFLDDELVEVLGVDEQGFVWRTVALDAGGHPFDEGDVLWREVVEGRPGHWRVTEVDTETATQRTKRERAEARAAKPKATPKPKPARLTAVPEADRLALHGHQVIAWQQTEGAPWEALLDRASGTAKALRETWASAAQGFRAREYSRGGKCVRDSLDEVRS